MASLKDVRTRIASIKTTRKITLARQMVSSVKLHRAQAALDKARAYLEGLEGIEKELFIPQEKDAYADVVPHKAPVGVVIISSNSGMCGQYNARIEKQVPQIVEKYGKGGVIFFPVGGKIRKYLTASGLTVIGDYDALADKAPYEAVKGLSRDLLGRVAGGELDSLEVVYHSFRNMASQQVVRQRIYPFETVSANIYAGDEYIIEPSLAEFGAELSDMLVCARIFAALASAAASEHAARTLAMQLATDNANDMLQELQLTYNKLRQQNITTELLDIIGSSFA